MFIPLVSFGQTYNLTNKTIGSPNYGEETTIKVEVKKVAFIK